MRIYIGQPFKLKVNGIEMGPLALAKISEDKLMILNHQTLDWFSDKLIHAYFDDLSNPCWYIDTDSFEWRAYLMSDWGRTDIDVEII